MKVGLVPHALITIVVSATAVNGTNAIVRIDRNLVPYLGDITDPIGQDPLGLLLWERAHLTDILSRCLENGGEEALCLQLEVKIGEGLVTGFLRSIEMVTSTGELRCTFQRISFTGPATALVEEKYSGVVFRDHLSRVPAVDISHEPGEDTIFRWCREEDSEVKTAA